MGSRSCVTESIPAPDPAAWCEDPGGKDPDPKREIVFVNTSLNENSFQDFIKIWEAVEDYQFTKLETGKPKPDQSRHKKFFQ